MNHLVNRYRLKEAKELFENIGEDLDDFYRLSQAVKNGQLSERNSKRLEELLGKFHVIKAAMRIIETNGEITIFRGLFPPKNRRLEVFSSTLDGEAFFAVGKLFWKKEKKNCIIEWICKYLQSCNSTWVTKDRKY